MSSIIDVKNLNISFKSKKKIINIIRGVDFQIMPGQMVGFIGESGSGKSVTAKSLLGINENSITSADTLTILGNDMIGKDNKVKEKNSSWRSMRGNGVSYIAQDPMTSLNPTAKIGKQIIEAMILNKPENEETLSKEEMKEEAIKILESFGVKEARKRINSYPHEFSGGMRQRVVIAMTVASKPKVIIADEPTTALDPTVQASVLKIFQEIVKDYGISVIIVSHDISVISKLCDFINVFYAGKIVESAPKKEFFSNPLHPYTWSLLAAMPEANNSKKLFTIDGEPPSFSNLPPGDPFSVRNPLSLKIDFKMEPPLFDMGNDHKVASWLVHPSSPKIDIPKSMLDILRNVKKAVSKGRS